ncbi:MAG: carboxypeptidase regulatory-like domain-containing protein [Candidatus Brocadiaceae bacterium]
MIEIKMTVPTSRTIQPQVWVNPPYFNLPQDSQDLSGPSIGEDAANCTVQIAQFAAMKAAEKLLDAVMPTECLKAVAGAGLDSYTIVLANELHDLHGNDNIQSAELLITDAVRVGLECTKSAAKYIPVVKIALAVKDAIDLGLEIQDMYSTCEKVGARVYEKFANVNVVGSADPNMKVGSNGVGNLHYITASEPLRYVVYFENKEDATAPAQEVVITDQLDTTKVDLHTFSLGVMTFGTTTVEPEPGLSEYTTDVDLRPANNLVVRINANLNMDTGVITWRFISLDPETGEPTEDPLAGFLPPNKTPPEGEGNVIFTIMPKNDLSTSTKIDNSAKIVFDINQPIVTNEWTNTIDKTKPESNILTLSDTQASPTFTVQWSGVDEGSGIRDYTIYVSEDGGPFTEWLINTTETSGVFSGKPGSHYAFYSIAHDNVFNHEDAPSEIDTTTMVVLENVEDCANGTDDDNDGLIDCNDPDCLSHKACHTEDCKNGLDDDGDGYTDCNDPDCIGEDCHISPVVKTTSATNVKTKSATLNGTINANDLAADVWFEYSTESGSYGNTTATQNVNVSDEVKINTEVNGLTPGKTYYFRIVAKTSIETVYGDEMSFTTSAAKNGKVAGKVIDESGIPMDAVKIKLKGKGVKKAKTATSNVKGAFVFKGISSGNYTIIATKEGYKNKKKKIKLDAGANKKVTIKMKKTAQNEISVEDLQDEASDE